MKAGHLIDALKLDAVGELGVDLFAKVVRRLQRIHHALAVAYTELFVRGVECVLQGVDYEELDKAARQVLLQVSFILADALSEALFVAFRSV